MYICNNWYMYVLVGCQLAWLGWDCPILTRPADSQLKRATRKKFTYTYTLLPPDDGQLTSPKHVEV
jgi:hypothetical protein